MAHHPRPIGHFSIGVLNLEVSKIFYDAVLTALGLRLVYESTPPDGGRPAHKPRTLGYGPDEDHEWVNIFEYGEEAHAPGRGSHIAFNALTRKAVDEFHAAALRGGGTCNGKPGVRTHYGPDYYAAFVIDPDGWRLEVVCKTDNN
jgi:catechol 2,3-dioxygenase-like lactoylglutathione lyase family enzyme